MTLYVNVNIEYRKWKRENCKKKLQRKGEKKREIEWKGNTERERENERVEKKGNMKNLILSTRK